MPISLRRIHRTSTTVRLCSPKRRDSTVREYASVFFCSSAFSLRDDTVYVKCLALCVICTSQ